jgi:aryl-alcohol dehydrogenase-like predicted oxidoreductase
MEYRRMGRSGLQLSVLSFGSWVTFHKQINDNSADELMSI